MSQEYSNFTNDGKSKRTRIDAIDGLRTIAVLSVIAFHFNFGFAPSGYVGVDIFFVISGYVISLSLTRNSRTSTIAYILQFYKLRILRIMPALIFCLITVGILATLFIPHCWLSASNAETGTYAFFGLSNFALLSGVDGYFDYRAEFNTFLHTWSLAVEEQFYLFFPLIFLIWLKRPSDRKSAAFLAKHLVLLLGACSLAWAAIETPREHELAFYMLPSRFWELAAGAVLFQYHLTGRSIPHSANTTRLIALLGIMLLAVGMVWTDQAAFPFPWALVSVGGTVALISAARSTEANESSVIRILRNPIVVYIGRCSYSLYLWHWPIVVMLRWTVGFDSAHSIVLASLLTIIFGLSSYHFVERPFLTSKTLRFLPAWQIVSTGVMLAVSIALITNKGMHTYAIRLSVVDHEPGWRASDLPSATINRPNKSQNAKSTIWVIGDSHAGAYRGMVRKAASQHGMMFRIKSVSGCPVANLREPYPDTHYCHEFVRELLDMLSEQASEGDIVFLASLRALRLSDQKGELDPDEINELLFSDASRKRREDALEQSRMIIQRLLSLGLTVIIDTPKPVFKAPPFRCSDWFNRMNPVCAPGFTISAALLRTHDEQVLESINTLKVEYPDLVVWDPFPILCRGNVCSAFSEGKPLFFDQDHLSGYGNQLLVQSFSKLLQSIKQPSMHAGKRFQPSNNF